jgi:4-hydroxy-tetrahydrodipicolinate synthase
MSLEFQADMFREFGSRILYKPEATPLGPVISGLRELTGGEAAIFEGSGGVLLIDSYRRGVTGTIPGVEMLEALVALWDALERGDDRRAYEVYQPICAMCTLQLQGGLDGFIVTERYLLHRQGLFPNEVHRGPLGYQLDEATRAEIDRIYALLQETLARA